MPILRSTQSRVWNGVIKRVEPLVTEYLHLSPVAASWDIGTLSYSEMLSLPDYSYADHYRLRHGIALPDFERPSRTEAADYFATYPRAAGLTTEFFPSTKVSSVLRTDCGFHIDPHNIHCKHLVLATGIFSFTIGPPAVLAPIAALDNPDEALLVIGSGFSAADVIISAPMNRKIVHIFKWNPETKPSPLRGCHHQAYPEYAGVYRQMKLAAVSSRNPSQVTPQMIRRKSNPFFRHRDWAGIYEGFPNAEILEVDIRMKKGLLRIRLETGEVVERVVGDLAYVVGRRGTLDYLDQSLRTEVLGASTAGNNVKPLQNLISGRTLRAKVEKSFEVAPDVFVVGSLAGDSLVRHAFGGCVSVASTIMNIGSGNGDKGNSHRSFMKRSELDSNGLASNGTAHEDLHVHRHQELTT